MPRMATGKPAGRPPTVLKEDGTRDPAAYKPSPKQLRAITAEVFFLGAQEKGSGDGRPWPVLASAAQVAAKANASVEQSKEKVTSRAIQKWRKEGWYGAHFCAAVGGEKAANRKQKAEAAKADRVRRQDTVAWAKKNWPEEGFAISPFNSRRYDSPLKYAQHLRAERAVPVEWITPMTEPGI